jgi:hypothetical protein
MIDEEQIRLFNELMSTQPGEQIEGLASRYPDVFEKPRLQEPTDPLKMRERIADSERKRKEQEEAEFQAKYGQKTIVDMARPEFIPDDITAAIKAIGTLGSGAGAGIKGMIGEAFGLDPEATVQRNIYFPDVLEKAKSGQKLTPDEERELAFYGRYIGKGYEGLEKVSDALESPMRAYEESKLDALMFMPGTRNISMIDDVIEMGIRGARDVAPIVKPAIQSAGQAARLAIRDDLLPLTQKATQATKEYFETPPVGAISLDTLGFSSRLSEGVDKLQDKGTGPQFLAQLSKMKGVPLAEIKVTGLDEYLRNTPKVTKQEVQDYLETNRLQLIEDERIAGAGRLTERDLNALPKEFDWLDRYDLDEQFEDKAHLRNHLMVTLNRHFDDLEADAADTGGFYAKDSSGEVRYIPESKKFEWFESEQDRIDDVLSEFPDFNAKTNFSNDYLIPGGQNYREILYKLPDDKVEGVFLPPASHYTDAMNTFGTIRSTDRTIDGTPTLFAEEIQSDWAIAGAKRGYAIDKKAELPEGTRIFAPGEANIPGASWSSFTVRIPNSVHGRNLFYGTTREEAIANAQSFIAQPTRNPVPDNPFRGNWYKPVINNFLVKAAQEGKGGIGFPVGEIIKDRYNLANVVDRIESSTDRTVYPTPLRGGPFKTVTIDLKPALAGANEKQMSLRVDKDGLVRGVNADQYNRFIGKPLTEVVGKGVSEKILSNDSQVMTDLDLKIGGEGKDKLYDDMLPKHLNEIGKRYGVQLEKRTIPFGEGDRKESEVYFMPITEEMRNDILSEGLPMFKQGGSVKKFAPGGKVLKEVAKGAKKAAKQATKETKSVIDDWEWRPSQQVIEEVGLTEVPEYIQSGFGNFMAGQQKRAKAGNVGIRDLIKAYTITRSSVNRSGLPRETATKTGMKIPKTEGLVRPEGAFSEWLGSKQGQNYLKAAERGEIDERAIADLQEKFAPFGMASVLANDMRWAVNNAPSLSDNLSEVIVGDPQTYRNVSQQLQGIGPAKSGFMGSLIGRGDFPTLDARQLRLHTGAGGSEAAKYMRRQQGLGGEQAVGRLADRQQGMNLDIDPALDPFYQHLTHHAVWDKVANEQTTHDDIVRAMTGYAKGGPIKSALEGVGKAAAEVKKTGKLTRLQKELRERGGEKQAQRLERAADEIPGLERLFHSRGLIEAFQGSEGFPYQGVVTMRPGDYKNFSQPLEVDLSEGRQGISPYSVQNIEDLRELIRRGRPFTSVPYLQLDKKGPLTIVSGHEGRHRTRAMEAEDMPATLVQVLPRHALKFKDLRNPSPSEWRQKLSEAMGPEGLVLPEGGMKLNPKFARASELAKKASEERDWNKFGALDRELSRYHKEDKVKLPDLEMLTEFPEVYQKGGAVKSMVSNTHIAPSDVVERTQLKKKGGLACLSK